MSPYRVHDEVHRQHPLLAFEHVLLHRLLVQLMWFDALLLAYNGDDLKAVDGFVFGHPCHHISHVSEFLVIVDRGQVILMEVKEVFVGLE